MTGATLAKTLNLLKSTIGASLTVGVADDSLYLQRIETQQEWFASMYDWNALNDEWQLDVLPGLTGQFTTFPGTDTNGITSAINFDRPITTFVMYSTKWKETTYGITVRELNIWNSSLGQVQDPIMKWQIKQGDSSKFEIWPLGSKTQTFRFVGQRKVNSLRTSGSLDTTKTLDLDDRLIAYAIAVEILTDKESPSAKLVSDKLNALWQVIRAAETKSTRDFTFGGAQPKRDRKIVPITVG